MLYSITFKAKIMLFNIFFGVSSAFEAFQSVFRVKIQVGRDTLNTLFNHSFSPG